MCVLLNVVKHMTGKTPLDERCLNFLGARVPEELQDELAELYARGYRASELIKESIRSASAKEGIMSRNKTVAHVETTITGAEG